MDEDKLARCMDVFARCVNALARIEGMKAENQMRAINQRAPAYSESHFISVIEEERVSWNDVMSRLFHGG
jgi:hypothetical protein